MKGLIVCAGKGSRLRPFTLSRPKTMIPVANKAILFYEIEKLANEGIRDIGIVIHPSQEAMIYEEAGDGEKFGVTLTYLYQNEPKGIADAVAVAEGFIQGSDFILMLGDNLVKEPLGPLMDQMITAEACILLTKVANPQQFGVAEINGDEIVRLVEKPLYPKSNLVIVGVYAFKSGIFDQIRNLTASARGELEITDAIQRLIDRNSKVAFVTTNQNVSDVGNTERWLEANIWMMDDVCQGGNVISSESTLINCILHEPVIIGPGCRLENCTIGPYVSIMSGTHLDDCIIDHSILLRDITISGTGKSIISSSILGDKVCISGSGEPFAKGRFILGDLSQFSWMES
ncbi:glucose-1-phosphate thymidylyltransferase [Paenibacillus sp.]|uniref:glucose-1-phosphate thymidylyltransferase n=1 Tax=Paenibacillus sp. TaxID=58172 RepID=UPI0028A76C6E|nr:glucose-1-phosphate thymidylyltransferase [Paenibacillus sp.]